MKLRTSKICSFLLLVTVVAATASYGQQSTAAPKSTTTPSDPKATDHHVVIAGGGTTHSGIVRSNLPSIRHWVLLATISADGSLGTISPKECAETKVEFSLDVPEKVGFTTPSTERAGVAVTMDTLESEHWGGSAYRIPWDTVHLIGSGEGERLYCVAYTSSIRLDSTDAGQVVTARIKEGPSRDPISSEELRLTGAERSGAVYEFSAVKLDRTSNRLIIVGRSVGDPYAYAGSQVKGTYAVILGGWDPERSLITSPSINACASAKVAFSLLSPKEAGVTPLRTEVGAAWVDSDAADELFEDTMDRYREDLQRCSGTNCLEVVPPPAPATRAAFGEGARETPWGKAPFFCVARAPVVLTANVGRQQVVAEVVRTGTSPDLSLLETMVQPEHEGSEEYLGDTPGGVAAFKPIRAHARPRPLLGVAISTDDISPPDSGDVRDDRHPTAIVAGFDFAVDPLLFDGWIGDTFPVLDALRFSLGTNVSGDVGNTIYFAVSATSLTSLTATANPIDLSLGTAFNREDSHFMFIGALTIDLAGTLVVLRDVLGI